MNCNAPDLWESIQKRIHRRVNGRKMTRLTLYHPLDENGYVVQKDDPDTLEQYVEEAQKHPDSKIKGTAHVEFGDSVCIKDGTVTKSTIITMTN